MSKKGKKSKVSDPHAAREAGKYENPIPSREYIIDFLTQEAGALSYEVLGEALHLVDDSLSSWCMCNGDSSNWDIQ